MLRAATLALFLTLLPACGPTHRAARGMGGALDEDLSARLASRAGDLLGETGPFRVGEARFQDDCSGFVAAVYEAEGLPLRRLMSRIAPHESSGVAAAYRAARAYGIVFGGGGSWPAPGDLVFFHDTYDRNRNRRLDDRFTHVGIVERIQDGSVTFLHRGDKAVARGTLTLAHAGAARGADGSVLNSLLRKKRPSFPGAQALAGQLFAGYGRIEPARVPSELARR